MSNAIVVKEFDWTAELEKTVVKSLTTTFGLDFLLAEDKRGGDVDTIHNVREYQKELSNKIEHSDGAINVSQEISSKLDKETGKNVDAYKKIKLDENGNPQLDNKGKIVKEDDYHHRSKLYKSRKDADRALERNGQLIDGYTGQKISSNDIKKKNGVYVAELDHIIAASSIHHDAGRILSGLDGVELANSNSNLVSTHWYINNIKNNHSNEDFFKKGGIKDKTLAKLELEFNQKIDKFNNISNLSEQEIMLMDEYEFDKWIGEYFEATNDMFDLERKKDLLESYTEEKANQLYDKAAKEYNHKINSAYYKSSKFLKATGKAMHKKGLEMGTRQALGLVLAEVWFELREQIPAIYRKHKEGFEFKIFLSDIAQTLSNIWNRVKERFKDLFTTFKDSYLGGALASLSTTLLNTFLTTQKLIGKLIREMWDSLVGVIKLIAFNPNNLSMGDLMREASKLLAFGVSTILGAMLNNYLNGILVFPYGKEIAAFVSALTVGIINLGFVYFLEHSQLAKKVWAFLNQFQIKTRIGMELERMREINAELDRYLLELSKIEFNLNPAELEHFANSLAATNDELERSFILKAEVERRNIDLPFESGNLESVRSWLGSLQKS